MTRREAVENDVDAHGETDDELSSILDEDADSPVEERDDDSDDIIHSVYSPLKRASGSSPPNQRMPTQVDTVSEHQELLGQLMGTNFDEWFTNWVRTHLEGSVDKGQDVHESVNYLLITLVEVLGELQTEMLFTIRGEASRLDKAEDIFGGHGKFGQFRKLTSANNQSVKDMLMALRGNTTAPALMSRPPLDLTVMPPSRPQKRRNGSDVWDQNHYTNLEPTTRYDRRKPTDEFFDEGSACNSNTNTPRKPLPKRRRHMKAATPESEPETVSTPPRQQPLKRLPSLATDSEHETEDEREPPTPLSALQEEFTLSPPVTAASPLDDQTPQPDTDDEEQDDPETSPPNETQELIAPAPRSATTLSNLSDLGSYPPQNTSLGPGLGYNTMENSYGAFDSLGYAYPESRNYEGLFDQISFAQRSSSADTYSHGQHTYGNGHSTNNIMGTYGWGSGTNAGPSSGNHCQGTNPLSGPHGGPSWGNPLNEQFNFNSLSLPYPGRSISNATANGIPFSGPGVLATSNVEHAPSQFSSLPLLDISSLMSRPHSVPYFAQPHAPVVDLTAPLQLQAHNEALQSAHATPSVPTTPVDGVGPQLASYGLPINNVPMGEAEEHFFKRQEKSDAVRAKRMQK